MGMARTNHQPMPSILRHLGINLVRPSQNPARQVMHFLETCLTQESNCLAASHARPAVRNNFAARVKLMHSLRQIPEGDEIAIEIADLVFVRFAHVENENVFFRVELLL